MELTAIGTQSYESASTAYHFSLMSQPRKIFLCPYPWTIFDVYNRSLVSKRKQCLLSKVETVADEKQLKCLLSKLETVVDEKQLKSELSRLLEGLGLEKQLKLLRELKELDWCVLLKVLRLMEGLESSDLLKLLEVLGDCERILHKRLCVVIVREGLEQQILLTMLEGLKPLERRKLLTMLEGLKPLERLTLLTVLEGLEPQKLLTMLEGLKPLELRKLLTVLEGLEPLEGRKLLTMLEGLKPLERLILLTMLEGLEPQKLLTMLEGLKPLELRKLLTMLEGLKPLELRKLLTVLEGLEPRKLLTILEGLEPQKLLTILEGLEPRKVLTMLEGLKPLEVRILLTVFEELSPQELRKLLIVLKGLLLLEPRVLLTVLKGLSLPEGLLSLREGLSLQEELSLLSLRGGMSLPEPPKLLTVLKGLKQEEKVLTVVELLGDLKQTKLLGLLELMEPVKLLKLLERVGPQERQNFYQLLEPLKLKMQLEPELPELKHLESLESKVEKLKRMKLQALLEAYKCLLQLLLEWLSVYLSGDGDRRGGFRNLLLDGWWLEFWEIILLAAGDVERNPGPRRMTDVELAKVDNRVLGKRDLFCVLEAVFECRTKWFDLCLALQLSHGTLSAIGTKHTSDIRTCLREGLTHWLQRDYDTEKHGPPTWRMLVDAVYNSCSGDDQALALDIAEKHKAVEAHSPQASHHCDDLERAKKMSSAFSSMYRSIVRLLRVNVNEVKDSLRYLTNPQCLDKLCVPPKVYKNAASTKDLLSRLCPKYINPKDTFVLGEIVTNFGSQRCKRLLKDYTDEFH